MEKDQKAGRFMPTLIVAISGAVVAGAFAVYTSTQNNKIELEKLKAQAKQADTLLQLEKDKLQLQKELEEANSKAQKEKAYSDDIHAHDEKVATLSKSLSGQYWEIRADNQCEEEVIMAVRYQALDGIWITQGWFHIEPKTITPVGLSTNSVIYYVAQGSASQRLWKTKADNPMMISDGEQFLILTGEWAPGNFHTTYALIHNIDRTRPFGPSDISFCD